MDSLPQERVIPWTHIEHSDFNLPRVCVQEDGSTISVYYSIYIIPESIRGFLYSSGRFLFQFDYLGEAEDVVSTPGLFVTIFTGKRTGRIWEIEVGLEKIKQGMEKHGSATPFWVGVGNTVDAELKNLQRRRNYKVKHYQILRSVIRANAKELFREIIS